MSTAIAVDNGAEQQARAQLASVCEMVAGLEPEECTRTEKCGGWHRNGYRPHDCRTGKIDRWDSEDEAREAAREAIEEDALSVEVRSGWYSPGAEHEAEEFCILLCTGGPAVRIVGELDRGQPDRARLEYQDWGTPWTELVSITTAEREALLTYAQVFYYGE